jgi:hypothetical protein
MIWAFLISLVVKSIRETVIARRRGEVLTLPQAIRSNFRKLRNQIKQKLYKNKKSKKMRSWIKTVFIDNEISK